MMACFKMSQQPSSLCITTRTLLPKSPLNLIGFLIFIFVFNFIFYGGYSAK